jgi:hypothetical protein
MASVSIAARGSRRGSSITLRSRGATSGAVRNCTPPATRANSTPRPV